MIAIKMQEQPPSVDPEESIVHAQGPDTISDQTYLDAFTPNNGTYSYFPAGRAEKIQPTVNSPVAFVEQDPFEATKKLIFMGLVFYFGFKFLKKRGSK